MATEKQTPDRRGLAQERMQPATDICRDVYGGTLVVREKKTKYLPRFEREEEKDYNARRNQSVLFNAFRRTVKGLVGMIHREPIKLSDSLPEEIRRDLENVDLAGRHLDVFARDLSEDAWIDGHAAILVDMQAVEPGEAQTLADERGLGLRPYWVGIEKSQILRVRTVNVAGRVVLSRFAYRETVIEDDGDFGEKEVERVRDYRLVTVVPEGESEPQVRVAYILYTKRKDKSGKERWDADPVKYMSINRIPVSTHYTNRTGFMESAPPLLDLAHLNTLHYSVWSDRLNVLHIASVPIPVLKGLRDSEEGTTVGVNSAIIIEGEHGDAFYMEPAGNALGSSADELVSIEQRMAYEGLTILKGNSQETARAKEIDKSESDSVLLAAVRDEEDTLENAIEIHALWRGVELERKGEDRWVEVNKDFVKHMMEPDMIRALNEVVVAGNMPVEEMWDAMKRGEVLPATFDNEAAREKMDAIPPTPMPRAA